MVPPASLPRGVLWLSKPVRVSLLVLVASVLLAAGTWHWLYYRELNGLTAAVGELPNVRLVQTRANYDVTIEELSLDLIVSGRHDVSWYFPEAPFNRAELFSSANALVLMTASGTIRYPLGPNCGLGREVGQPICGGADVLQNLSRILKVAEEDLPVSQKISYGQRDIWLHMKPDIPHY